MNKVALSGHLPYFAKDEEYATQILTNYIFFYLLTALMIMLCLTLGVRKAADYLRSGADVTFKSYFVATSVSRDNARFNRFYSK